MTLGRLVFAWLPVAAWFAAAAWAAGRVTPAGTFALARVSSVRALARPALEAALVTLFASLWFDSLGHSGWWLLFALVGALVGLARAPRGGAAPGALPSPGSRRALVLWFLADVARYVAAGALLAWRLA